MKIVTSVVNNPDFIEIQYYTLKKFFKGDYEFIVFNDAKAYPDFTNDGDITIKSKIEELCNQLNIKCINIPNEHNRNCESSVRVADSMNYILSYQKNNPDKYLCIDSDMFLIDYFDINKFEKYDCAILLQNRPEIDWYYIWNGIYYFDMTKMNNLDLLNWNVCSGCDTGGMMQEWLLTQINRNELPTTREIRWTNKIFHTEKIYFIKHLWSCTWNESEIP